MKDDDFLLHLERTATEFVADSSASRPGTLLTLKAGDNRLTVESSGANKNSRLLKINDVEAVTDTTLQSYAQAAFNDMGSGLTMQPTPTIEWSGAGTAQSPTEALPKLPIGNERDPGVVKIVNAGSHGFPAAGYSFPTFAVAWDPVKKEGVFLRNGQDDLERDVFVSHLSMVDGKLTYTPTADRYRPVGLPATAKPVHLLHGMADVALLKTTNGPFLLFTQGSIRPDEWMCIKIDNPELQSIEWEALAYVVNGRVYLLRVGLNNHRSMVEMWAADILATDTMTLTRVNLTGTNFSGTPQNGPTFTLFNKAIGTVAERPMVANPDGGIEAIDVARLEYDEWTLRGDSFYYMHEGTNLRICHRGSTYFYNKTGIWMVPTNVSYVVNLTTGVVTPDTPERYPNILTATGATSVADRNPCSAIGADWCGMVIKAGGINFGYDTYGRGAQPRLYAFDKPAGQTFTEYDNYRAGMHLWVRTDVAEALGLYGTPVKMSFAGQVAIGNKTLIGSNVDGTFVSAEYDPYGTYSPTIPGYGPTNNRAYLDEATYLKMRTMLWVFDGDRQMLNGVTLTKEYLSAPTLYEGGVFSHPLSMSAATYDRLALQVQGVAVTDIQPSLIVDRRLVLNIPQLTDAPCHGSLSIIYRNPSNNQEKLAKAYLITFKPDRTQGELTALTDVKVLRVVPLHDHVMNYREYNIRRIATAGYYRLADGMWAITTVGCVVDHMVNHSSLCSLSIYDPKNRVWLEGWSLFTDYNRGEGFMGTKELGIGWLTRINSGEATYLRSYGKTRAELITAFGNTAYTKVYSLIMTRSDAGDNVAISQFAGTAINDKVNSLVPPGVQIQGMDLSQDRTVTRAMIPDADLVPLLPDIEYPTTEAHISSLVDKSPTDHTHTDDDFLLADATIAQSGISILGDLTDPAASAFRVDLITVLTDELDVLTQREFELDKLDMSITVDYEV